MTTVQAANGLTLSRSKTTRAKWGTYTTYASGLLTSPNGQTWRFTADNAGGGHYGGHLTLVVEHDDERGRGYACGQSGIWIGPVAGGRGVADRLAAAAVEVLATAVHVKDACGVCSKDPSYVIQWQSADQDGRGPATGRYFVKDLATGEKVVEGLADAQAGHRWLADRAADAVEVERVTAAARLDAEASQLPQTVWIDPLADGISTPRVRSECSVLLDEDRGQMLVTVMPNLGRYFTGIPS